jgi:hypothetical protein
MPRSSDDRSRQRDDPVDRGDVAALTDEILALLGQVTERFESQEHEEWRWIEQHSPDQRVVELLRASTITALRVLDAIGRLEPVNGIQGEWHYDCGTGSHSQRHRLEGDAPLDRAETRWG